MIEAVRIAGLEIERELGRGSFSVVYRARHGDRLCAVKLARHRGRASRWFRREAFALARIRHPGVPAVLDVGEVDARPYLVMALVEGTTLRERLEHEAPGERETIALGIELFGILAAVHDGGLVHRDVKPENVIIDDRDRVHLVDFGLVTHLSAVPEPTSAAGTRHYAAPEQLRTPQLADGRADLYAAGRILSECLEYRLPSPGLRRVLEGLLAEAPEQRYRSARTAARDLDRVRRGGEPHGPGAGHASVRPPSTRFVGRNVELERLHDAWEGARNGRGRVVLLEGAAGSGKTRTLRELRRTVAKGGGLVLGATGGPPAPLAAVRELVDAHLAEIARRAPEERTAAYDRLRSCVPVHARPFVASISPALAGVLGAPAEPAREHREPFAETVAAALLALARAAAPTLLFVDDAPRLDPLSREILARVALGARAAPLLFVLAARSTDDEDAGLERFAVALADPDLLRVELAALSADEIAALAADYLGAPALDPPLRTRIVSLAEGTPLGVLELVGALVDGGALHPQWGGWRFDRDVAERIRLPRAATALMTRRIDALPAATRHVLRVAALLRTKIDADLLGRVCGVDATDVGFAFSEASRAGLLEIHPGGEPAFVHGAVSDGLLLGLAEGERREIHRAIASTLGQPEEPTLLLEAAHHLEAGYAGTPPAATYRVALAAGERAAADGDHDTAVRYHALARRAARSGGIALSARAHRLHAESLIQIGALDESLPLLADALRRADGLERARVLARTAWVHQAGGDAEQAWTVLRRAFAEVGEPMPTERPATLARAMAAAARSKLLPAREGADVERLTLVCALHYQNARLGVDYARPGRTLQSALAILDIGRRLPPSGTLARAHAMYGAFMSVLGRHGSGRRHLDAARTMATRLGDPAALGPIAQFGHVQACFIGDVELALHHARSCLDDYGAWLEVGDYCLVAGNARFLEAVRGRPARGLAFLQRAVARARRRSRRPAILSGLVVPALRATLEAMGREDSLEYVTAADVDSTATTRGLHDFATWGPRATSLVERGELGPAFEELVHAFRGTATDPRRAHPVLAEYYIAVAHGRALQCFGEEHKIAASVRQLDAALSDLKKVARIPLFQAHLQSLRGIRALCVGDTTAARQAFIAAEELGSAQQAPWVLYTAARGMAHLHRTAGNEELALASAQLAAKLAREHEAPYRLALIEAEFGLEPAAASEVSEASSRRSSSRRSRQLHGVVGALRLRTQEAGLVGHSRSVLDEVIRATDAARGLLYFHRPGGVTRPHAVARLRGGGDWLPEDDGYAEVVARLKATAGADRMAYSRSSGRSLMLPLLLYDEPAGAMLLERAEDERAFSPDAFDVLTALAPQVPLALELACLLEERDRLGIELQRAARMEAVGQLASGVAHDFGNMLTVIAASLDELDTVELHDDARCAVGLIREAATKATDLTHQLLAFSRGRVLDVVAVDLGACVSGMLPLLLRLVSRVVDLQFHAPSEPFWALIDQPSFELAIVNLAVNARDAMPSGGRLVIEITAVGHVADEELESIESERGFVRVDVSDTGQGMRPEVLERVFEPFFTTKNPGDGTGLGLASVYGVIKQSEGVIRVASKPGEGTTFSIYLKRTTAPSRPTVAAVASPPVILLVEDEALVRSSTTHLLRSAGYEVVEAEGAEKALGVLADDGAIDLVITDVRMPGMDGEELARKIHASRGHVPILFISSFADAGQTVTGDVEFIRKPFASDKFVQRVRRLLPLPPPR